MSSCGSCSQLSGHTARLRQHPEVKAKAVAELGGTVRQAVSLEVSRCIGDHTGSNCPCFVEFIKLNLRHFHN